MIIDIEKNLLKTSMKILFKKLQKLNTYKEDDESAS